MNFISGWEICHLARLYHSTATFLSMLNGSVSNMPIQPDMKNIFPYIPRWFSYEFQTSTDTEMINFLSYQTFQEP